MFNETDILQKLETLRESMNFIRTLIEENGATISMSGEVTIIDASVEGFDYVGYSEEFKAINDEYQYLQYSLDQYYENKSKEDSSVEIYGFSSKLPSIPISSPTGILSGLSNPFDGAKLTPLTGQNTVNMSNNSSAPGHSVTQPFDPRLARRDGLLASNGADGTRVPYANNTVDSVISDIAVKDSPNIQQLTDDPNSYGLQSMMNPYALVRFYNGIEYKNGNLSENRLLDVRDQHRFYSVNPELDADILGSSNPTTTNIIKYGCADKWGRTPYSFQDFVFCKYWNVIPNNRLITLRKYSAPCVDSLNFDGMEKELIPYSPIATAVTFFGEGTDNKLSQLLNFSTGLRWELLESNVWDVLGEGSGLTQAATGQNSVANNLDGRFFANTLGYMAKIFALANGDYSYEQAMMEHGNLPPDPYSNGPYTNRLIGPANRIDAVYKRKGGLDFKMPLEVKFHYVARPIGGVNPKAALLDILSNFLVMCSASAMFWGGANRFMLNPQTYPFFAKNGQSLLQKLYRGEVFGENGAIDLIKEAATSANNMGSLSDFVSGILGAIGGAAGKILSITGIGGENLQDKLTSVGSAAGQEAGANLGQGLLNRISTKLLKTSIVPYMTGMRSLLIGEPVGDWHLTIGNPLNPIAVIGNLICTGMKVEFSDELGPDDFPMEMTVTVSLEHGMARDRDAIESMFNRGSGRIYNLPDTIRASSDFETTVDNVTGTKNPNAQRPEGNGNGSTWIERNNTQVSTSAGSSEYIYKQHIKKNPEYTALNLPKIDPLDSNVKFDTKNDIEHRSVFNANPIARKIGLT